LLFYETKRPSCLPGRGRPRARAAQARATLALKCTRVAPCKRAIRAAAAAKMRLSANGTKHIQLLIEPTTQPTQKARSSGVRVRVAALQRHAAQQAQQQLHAAARAAPPPPRVRRAAPHSGERSAAA
jgi:hypothetical protein